MAKIILTANKGRLMFDTSDSAFIKRLLPIPFEVTFTTNPALVSPPYVMLEDSMGCDRLLSSVAAKAAMLRWV